MKRKKLILTAFLIIVATILVIILAVNTKKTPENEELPSIEGIEPGEYFSDYPVGYLKIDNKGKTTYYPDLFSNQSYEGVCSITNNVLSINSNYKYWKFKIIDEQLQLIEEKVYGEVNDCREKERIFTHAKENPGLMEGTSYYAIHNMRLYYGKGEVRLYHKNELLCMSKEFSFEDNVLEFVVAYEWKGDLNDYENFAVIDVHDYESLEGDLKPGFYYNSDLSTELIIREDGVVEFYSDTEPYINVVGRYECVDGKMVLKKPIKMIGVISYWDYIVEDYVFEINDDKLVYTQYTDMYKNTTKYDETESNTFFYSEKSLINRIKPGKYYFEYEGEEYSTYFALWFDNEGTVSVSGDMGTYENNNGNITIKLDNGKELSAIVKDGRVYVSNYNCIEEDCPTTCKIEGKYADLSVFYFKYYYR